MTNIETAISILRDKRGQIDVAIRALEAVRDGRDVGAAIGIESGGADRGYSDAGRGETVTSASPDQPSILDQTEREVELLRLLRHTPSDEFAESSHILELMALAPQKWTTAAIATAIGRTQRFVQKRIVEGQLKSPADVPTREDGRAEGRDRPAAVAASAADASPPSPSPAAVAPIPAQNDAPGDVPAAGDTAPEPSWKDWFAQQWHAGVDLGELTKQFKLTFAEIDSLVQELGIVGSPQRRQATRDALAALKVISDSATKTADPIALWTKTRKTDFAAAYRSGQAEDAIRKAFNLTWEHYYRALEILSLRGDRKRADALAVEKAKRPPHNAGKPSVWTEAREADFTRVWERGDDLEEIASFFRREHDLNLTSGGIAAHASVRDLSNNAKRKAARSHKTAAFQARAARRRLEKSVSQGRTPASALIGLATPNERLGSAGLPPIPDSALRPDEGPPRADTVVFAAPVNGSPAAEPQALQEHREPAGGAGAPAATGRQANLMPAPDAKTWPLPKRAFVTAGWKQGQTYEQIAEAATAGGYPMKPKDVIQAVPQLGLTNDPDRRSAMHGGGVG